jgi:glycosyltransferase involved in cell wall biosynthesis
MKVSVIIPNYNHAPFLKKRIDSVLEQTYQNFEIIILDDCSTDNSRDIIEQYAKHEKVSQIVFNDKNSGSPFTQWQKGFALSIGDYIWIAESDDWAENKFLEILVDKLNKNQSIGLAYCQSNIVDSVGSFIRSNKSWTDDINKRKWRKSYSNRGFDEIKSALCYKNTIPNASAVLLKKELLLNDFTFPVNMKMAGDWFCWIQILKKTNILYVPLCLNNFRSTLSSTRNHSTFAKIVIRINEEIMILNHLLEEHIITQNTYKIRLKGIIKSRLTNTHYLLRKMILWLNFQDSTLITSA